MKRTVLTLAALALAGAWTLARAHETTYNVTLTFFEPQTQPKNSIFEGSFVFDQHAGAVSNLKGKLSESMTGTDPGNMTWLDLNHQLSVVEDTTLGGWFVTTFKNADTKTFYGGTWTPEAGIAAGGTYYDFNPIGGGQNKGNAYAMIFVPFEPLTPLTQAQIDKLAYADCAPGGMMGAACMTGTSVAGYGSAGTMDGYPLSQTITAAVPEPQTYAMLAAGLGLLGLRARPKAGTTCAGKRTAQRG